MGIRNFLYSRGYCRNRTKPNHNTNGVGVTLDIYGGAWPSGQSSAGATLCPTTCGTTAGLSAVTAYRNSPSPYPFPST